MMHGQKNIKVIILYYILYTVYLLLAHLV